MVRLLAWESHLMKDKYRSNQDIFYVASCGGWESARRYALLRVPRPLRELLLYLRKAYRPTDFVSAQIRWQGKFKKLPALMVALIDVHSWLQKF